MGICVRSSSTTVTEIPSRRAVGDRDRAQPTEGDDDRLSPRSVSDEGSARLLVEERQGDRGEERRGADVVVGQAGQDRERVAALRPALAHPAAVA